MMKEFDYEAAKNGAPICTRDGHPARIICWDSKSDVLMPIVALIDYGDRELIYNFREDGKFMDTGQEHPADLKMADRKKCEGWVNVYYSTTDKEYIVGNTISDTEWQAKESIDEDVFDEYRATIKIEWEEKRCVQM